jgi:tRNA uridine 5-carbamoylmethylation protein Kti12
MEKELIILVGPIGSGKTTFAKTLETSSSIRISQDEMGRKAYLEHFKAAMRDSVPRIIVDRMNFDKEQRERFIKPAREAGYCVSIFELRTDIDVCIERVVNRPNHPTVESGDVELAQGIVDRYLINYEAPMPDEYDNLNYVEAPMPDEYDNLNYVEE